MHRAGKHDEKNSQEAARGHDLASLVARVCKFAAAGGLSCLRPIDMVEIMRRFFRSLLAPLALASPFLAGCGAEDPAPTPEVAAPAYEPNFWEKIEIPGTVCGNGSQYKFFMNRPATKTDNVLVVFEPGGACWDYDSCAGKTSLGASNTNGISDGHMSAWQIPFPFLNRDDENNPLRDYNLVYMPYCTGDVHVGDTVKTYVDPSGQEPDLVFHHHGYRNMLAASDYMAETFPHVGKLVVYGCSAGGVGSISSHYFVRKALAPERAYLLDDSGPVFPGSVHSQPLYGTIRAAWDLDAVFATLPFTYDPNDLGALALRLSDELPDDRLGVTYFLRDHTFSAYSYARFFPELSDEQRLDYWKDDTDLLVAAFETRKNLAYYLPYWRARADSHCTSILDYNGTEIQEAGVDLSDFIDNLLDDSAPLQSFRESIQHGEDGTP